MAMPLQNHYFLTPLGALMLMANSAVAADRVMLGGFSSEINGSQIFSYDSNPLRLTSGEKSLFGSTTSPELMLRWKTPTSTTQSTTRVDVNVFDRSEFDSVDLHQKLSLSKSNQRWTADLDALVDYDTTRTSELTNYAINLPRVHNTRLGAKPKITLRHSERGSVSLAGSFVSSTYDNGAYTDYNAYSISPSYAYAYDQKNIGSVALNGQRYETINGASLTSDSFGPSVGWTHFMTQRLTLRVNAGALSTHRRGAGAGTERNSWDYVFSGNATYKGAQDTIDFNATRAREPFGNGTETLLDTFSLTERHAINPQLEVNAKAKYQEADYPTTAPGINLDKGYNFGTGIAYKIVEDASLTADYTYRNEKLTNISGDVAQHVVMIGATIHPSWSGK
jgi:hypothetical protein